MANKINTEEAEKTTKKAAPKTKNTDKKTVKKTTAKKKVETVVEELNAANDAPAAVETVKDSQMTPETKAVEQSVANSELESLLKKIAEDNKVQAAYAQKQYNMSRITAVCATVAMLIVLVSAVLIVPRAVGSLTKVESTVSELEGVAKTLSEEVPALLESTTELIGDENSGLVQAVGNFNKFDIETLNEAINELKMAVEPFAMLFGGH